jgi:predicted kinase
MASRPALIVVSGPPGAGKTTLAHALGQAVGCPVICRDEIKEGMAHADGLGAAGGPPDDLAARTLPVFFGVLATLVRAGVSVVAEAAFQDRLWKQGFALPMPGGTGLVPLVAVAGIRVVHCEVPAEVAWRRATQRAAAEPRRAVHEDASLPDPAAFARRHEAFKRIAMGVPELTVQTTDGYRPGLAQIAAFASG